MKMDYHKLRQPAVVYTVLCLVVIMLVAAFFGRTYSTHRWIKLGPAQNSAVGVTKLAVILYLCLVPRSEKTCCHPFGISKEDLMNTILPAVAPILLCVALIVMQPDLGTSVDIVLIMTAILYVAGLSWKWLAVGLAGALPVLFFLITHVSYRMARLMAFLHPERDPQGACIQTDAVPDRSGFGWLHGSWADGK